MNKLNLLLTYPLFLLPALLAQSPFDGTWRMNDANSKLPTKPYVFSVDKGMYDSAAYTPKIHVKADGTDQPVIGQFWDSLSVRELDPKTLALVGKKAGKLLWEQTRTVSDDGKTLTSEQTSHLENSDQVSTSEARYTRVGKAPPGAHAASGAWRMDKLEQSENGLSVTYKSSGDEFSMSDPTGASYTAKLDGKDYPVKGDYSYNAVSLRRLDERTIEETDKRDGKVVSVSKLTVSADGKKMTAFSTDYVRGRTGTYVYEKQ